MYLSTAPHVIYKTDKKPDEPCSITSSLAYFPDEEGSDQNVTGPPRIPPSNLTVVTVEGCPSFVILDWQKSDNETRGMVNTNERLTFQRVIFLKNDFPVAFLSVRCRVQIASGCLDPLCYLLWTRTPSPLSHAVAPFMTASSAEQNHFLISHT